MTNILITKETRAEETRVALVPSNIKALINNGHKIYIEHNAGEKAGFSDQDYQRIGAEIRDIGVYSPAAFKLFFENINMIVRVKRPNRGREILENSVLLPRTIMIGALDPLEKNSSHIEEYHHAGILAYSIDQMPLPPTDPMNLLAAMSKIAGRLALLDAINKFASSIKKVVIIGYGVVGHAAFDEALSKNLSTTVILNNPNQASEIEKRGGKSVLIDNNTHLEQQQTIIKHHLLDADIVVTSARRANQASPLLITLDTLEQMNKGAVIVDLALSEGGNVEGSEHDTTRVLGNEVIVTNTSGYPKALPHEASQLWSTATLLFIQKLLEGTNEFLPC